MPSKENIDKGLSFPVQYVKGIGPKRAEALANHNIKTVRDLIYYFPYDYIDLSKVGKIGDLRKHADSEEWVTVIGTIRTFDLIGRPPRQRLSVILEDESGTIQLVFFQSVQYFKKAFEVGEIIAASGKVTIFNRHPQIVHPSIDRLSPADDEDGGLQGFLHTRGIVPKYGSSGELQSVNLNIKGFRRIMKATLNEFLQFAEEPLPSSIIDKYKYLPIKQALSSIHFPETQQLLDEARLRLKFDELFSMQLLLALRRQSVKVELPGITFDVKSSLARQLVDSLPFKLTKAQVKVIKEITDDLKSGKPMNRLLQGDVGSGKTIVALVAMLIGIDNGYQTTLMAPTEILAEQHFKTLANFLKDLNVNVQLLIGGQRVRIRDDVLEDIRSGAANIVVGTHALIQEPVVFKNLGLVIIDEQHRFGVAQRVALREKGIESLSGCPHPHILVMTATPIPRTLSLTVYGDLDVSTINELPAHRIPIKTILNFESQISSVYRFVREQVKDGRQVYIVYPLVEESEKLDLKAATESYEKLKSEVFTDYRVGLIHGRMSSDEKDNIMTDFEQKKIDILVSTTVIEVGIDVPNASVMVVEHAERLGLSQLHQLRGRVGRGAEQSYCILIAPGWMGRKIKVGSTIPTLDGAEDTKQIAERRLRTMLETLDGFKIAEIDLELRGPGDYFGTRQSGLPALRLANLLTDGDILLSARHEAFQLIDTDPHLRLPEHHVLRKSFDEWMKDALGLLHGG